MGKLEERGKRVVEKQRNLTTDEVVLLSQGERRRKRRLSPPWFAARLGDMYKETVFTSFA